MSTHSTKPELDGDANEADDDAPEQDPLLRILENAPLDDEPTTPEEDASCKEAWEEYKRGEYMTAEEAERELFK